MKTSTQNGDLSSYQNEPKWLAKTLTGLLWHRNFLSSLAFNVGTPRLYYIMITCPCNEHPPFTPHFYIGKLGFTRVNIFFLISALKHRLWVLYVLSKDNENITFLSENYHFYSREISTIYIVGLRNDLNSILVFIDESDNALDVDVDSKRRSVKPPERAQVTG